MSEVATKTRPGTALTVYERIGDPMVACKEMAKAISSLVNCSLDQAPAVMLTCLCEGMTPLQFQRKYHLIQGKPSMKADAMLASFRVEYGGKHKVIERSSDRAAIELFDNEGEKFSAEFTWKEAQGSRWPWKDPHKHEAGLKDNWSTDTDRKAMLWARLVSDSIRAFCPEVVAGVYTPEEISDILDVEYTVSPGGNGQATKISAAEAAKQLAGKAAKDAESRSETPADGDVIEAEFVAAGEASASDPPFETTEAKAETATESAPVESESEKPLGKGYATKSQIAKLTGLFETLGVSREKQIEVLRKRGVAVPRSLTKDDCQQIIDKLEAVKQANTAVKN